MFSTVESDSAPLVDTSIDENGEVVESVPTESLEQCQEREPVTFTTSGTTNYPQRTKENADWSDITLAIATDFNIAGEKLTKRVAGNKYISSPIPGDGMNDDTLPTTAAKYYADEIVKEINSKRLPTNNIKLNIAGNGIYTLSEYSQEEVDNYVTALIQELQNNGITIAAIRSGGQTGIDEAGIKAAIRLGIPAEVHSTSDFKFRDKSGRDISNEQAFKDRFINGINTEENTNNEFNNGNEFSTDEMNHCISNHYENNLS